LDITEHQVDAHTIEIVWKREDGRVHREQFTGRSPQETQKYVEERKRELSR